MNSKFDIKIDPSFERIRKTLLLEEKADRAPLCDFSVADNIKEWSLGRPLARKEYFGKEAKYQTILPEEEVEFWLASGYDYVHARPFYDFNINNVTTKEGSALAEGIGIIQSMDILGGTVWPWQKHDDFCYDHISETAEILPSDMKLII